MSDVKEKAEEHVRNAVKNLARTITPPREGEHPMIKVRREQQTEMLKVWEYIAEAVENYGKV